MIFGVIVNVLDLLFYCFLGVMILFLLLVGINIRLFNLRVVFIVLCKLFEWVILILLLFGLIVKIFILLFLFWIVGWIVNLLWFIIVNMVFKCIIVWLFGILIVNIFLNFEFFVNRWCVNFFKVFVFVCWEILIVIILLFKINLFLFLIWFGFLWFNYILIFLLVNFGWCFKIYFVNIDLWWCVLKVILLMVILFFIDVEGLCVKYKFGIGFM